MGLMFMRSLFLVYALLLPMHVYAQEEAQDD